MFGMRHGHHGGGHKMHNMMRHAMRGGGFGRGGDFAEMFGGRGGGFGGHRGGRRRVIDGGELRLVLLKLIGDEPRHGYDLIRAIEELTGGAYAPSPGMIYPTVTMLEEMGQIAEQDGAASGKKRLFAITEAGTAELAEQAEQVEALFARLKALAEESGADDRSPVRRAMMNLAMAVRMRHHRGAAGEINHEIAAILDEAARKVERL